MFHIFGLKRERKNESKTTFDPLISQQCKKRHSRLPHVRRSLQILFQTKRRWTSIDIDRHQVIIIKDFFFVIVSCEKKCSIV